MPLHPHVRASHALTRQRAQQSPWEHWAPARREQLWAEQQVSRHSWSRKGKEGPGEGAARGTLGPAGGGASLASGAGRADLTWPAPQSHSSPSSTKLFPQCAGGTRSPESGALDRHAPPPLRKKARSCLRLQALNTRGNGCLRAGKGVGRAGTPTPTPCSPPIPSHHDPALRPALGHTVAGYAATA